jgi:hypothetical protein
VSVSPSDLILISHSQSISISPFIAQRKQKSSSSIAGARPAGRTNTPFTTSIVRFSWKGAVPKFVQFPVVPHCAILLTPLLTSNASPYAEVFAAGSVSVLSFPIISPPLILNVKGLPSMYIPPP